LEVKVDQHQDLLQLSKAALTFDGQAVRLQHCCWCVSVSILFLYCQLQ
jgi:hypothetical protein